MKPLAIGLLLVVWAVIVIGALAAVYFGSQATYQGEAVPETRQW